MSILTRPVLEINLNNLLDNYITLKNIANHEEIVLAEGPITMDSEMLRCGESAIPLADITHLDIHGRWGLVFSTRDGYYELRPDKKYNALKFYLLYDACCRQAAVCR